MLWAIAYIITAGITLGFAFGEVRLKSPTARIGATLLILLAICLGIFALQEASGIFGQAVTGTLRQTAKQEGWYNERRGLQGLLVNLLLPLGALGLAGMVWYTRRAGKRYWALGIALMYLCCFGALQAISLHQWDARLRQRDLGIRLVTWGNMVGVGGALLALIPLIRAPKSAAPPRPARRAGRGGA